MKKKATRLFWSPAHQTALKPRILSHPNFNLSFVVYTNASEKGFRAALVQTLDHGNEEILAERSYAAI